MKNEKMYEAIGNINEDYIKSAHAPRVKRQTVWVKWGAMAACLCLIVGAVIVSGRFILNGGNPVVEPPGTEQTYEHGASGDNDLSYMYYPGPILPLTVQENGDGITAERNIDFNFSPYITQVGSYENKNGVQTYETYRAESIITDSYTLKNETGKDLTVTLLYPYIGALVDIKDNLNISVDGFEIPVALHFGKYLGEYEGVWGDEQRESGSVNLKQLYSFEQYAELLSDNEYSKSAFDDLPELNQNVIVYKLHDFVCNTETDNGNPSLTMEFYADSQKTTVFSYGMDGASWDEESGYHARIKGGIEYQPYAEEGKQYPSDGYVILVGEDIHEYKIISSEGAENISCTVTRYETTLGEIVQDLLKVHLEEDTLSLNLNYGLTAELLLTVGALGDNPIERYETNMLESIFDDVQSEKRIIYGSFDVTIPEGKSIAFTAVVVKDGSVDYAGDNLDKNGYDMATKLGSNLTFTAQTASVSEYSEIEIVRQNFGFDLSSGINEVSLDINKPHYWMEVSKLGK